MQPATPEPRAHEPWSRAKMDQYFRGAAFVVLLVIGGIATLRAYFALESAILVWLKPQFVALTQAGFSLVILAIVIWLIRSWVIARAE